ncbi:MAG TPA: YciI family protein [Chitinophaga sp.]|uniref:YciI family protein n=1 Tax=Chitinophaga sp. TaxID=1869181 RepID=UPI002CA3D71A|nr:YciI family protein [Chitinophaga sp.]HVI44975.1 YciI family protein [Chitinophaga sp.]
MKEFVLIFRNKDGKHDDPTPDMLQERMNWLAGIAARNRLANAGNSLSADSAKTVRPDNIVTDGPFTEIKEFINGYVIVLAMDIDEAVEMAKANPLLKAGGTVEVREVIVRKKQ